MLWHQRPTVHLLLAAALLAGACRERQAPPPPPGDTGVIPPQVLAGPTTISAISVASVSPRPADDSLIALARALIGQARPGFTEWRTEQYVRLADSAASSLPPPGPVLGDFDDDGQPDVLLDGWDPHGELVPALLSNRGKPRVANVTEGPGVAVPAAQRGARVIAGPCDWKGKKRQCVHLVTLDATGSIASRAVYLWVNGHFSELVDGE